MYTHSIDPVLVQLGPVAIRYYGLAYLLAFILTYYWLRRRSYGEEFLDDLVFYGVIGVILGGRLGYFLFYNPTLLVADPIELVQIWHGGMAFHGGLIGAVLGGAYTVKRHDVSFYDVADDVSIPVLVGLGLGRVANFINGEIVGTVTNLAWCVNFPPYPGCRHPVQLYLALKNVVVAAGLVVYERYDPPRGLVFWQFILWYAIGRFVIDFVREEPTLWLVSTGQYLTLAMIVVSMYYVWKKY